MDTQINSIILVSVLLLIVSLSYVVYVVYTDSEKIRETINTLTGQVNDRLNVITGNVNGISNQFNTLLEAGGEESEDSEEEDESDDEEYTNTEHAIYDKLLSSNSDQLKRLQLVQSEFENGKVEEISETEGSGSDGEDEDSEAGSDEDGDVEFVSTQPKEPVALCTKILKTGKNKGNVCGKEATADGGDTCKMHKSA